MCIFLQIGLQCTLHLLDKRGSSMIENEVKGREVGANVDRIPSSDITRVFILA